jgi:abequosyltransferase
MPSAPILSICISTFNRARFIGETIESIVCQLSDSVELVVLDGASPDDTQAVVSRFIAADQRVRYVREATNSGIDQDYDKAVAHARGQYCWLMSDDDLLVPGAVDKVLRELESEVDLLVVNAKVMDLTFERLLRPRLLPLDSDQHWNERGGERLFATVGNYLSFIGGVVVRRAFWLSRPREPYYGTMFVHIGALFQAPAVERATVIADPLIVIRYGNATWSMRGFEIWMFRWPRLVWSFDHFSVATRSAVTAHKPFRQLKRLLFLRAVGSYSMEAYRQHLASLPFHVTKLGQLGIARTPGKLANFIYGAYFLLRPGRGFGTDLYDLAHAQHASPLMRQVARSRGLMA